MSGSKTFSRVRKMVNWSPGSTSLSPGPQAVKATGIDEVIDASGKLVTEVTQLAKKRHEDIVR